jgi:circadian clock protein KaiB
LIAPEVLPNWTELHERLALWSRTPQVDAQRSSVRPRRRTTLAGGESLLSKYVLKLYVAGSSSRTDRAVANLRRICEEELENRYELVIIDVLENPQLAEDDKILATPTLIKQLPPPLRRVIGDLSDKEKVLLGLEVRALPDAPLSPPPPAS